MKASMRSSDPSPPTVAKAEKKEPKKPDVDQIIVWPTGYGQKNLRPSSNGKPISRRSLQRRLGRIRRARRSRGDLQRARRDIKEPTMQVIRYLDKLIDELAVKAMEKLLRH